MAQMRQQQRRCGGGGGLLLLAVVMVLLSFCCSDSAAAAGSPGREYGGVAATASTLARQEDHDSAPGISSTAARGRVEMEEVTEDYALTGANNRHNPIPAHP